MKSTVLKEKKSTHLKRHGLLYLLFFIAIAVFVYRLPNSVVSHSGSSVNGSFEVGSLAPKFILRNLQGNLEGIDDYKDKVIILNAFYSILMDTNLYQGDHQILNLF